MPSDLEYVHFLELLNELRRETRRFKLQYSQAGFILTAHITTDIDIQADENYIEVDLRVNAPLQGENYYSQKLRLTLEDGVEPVISILQHWLEFLLN